MGNNRNHPKDSCYYTVSPAHEQQTQGNEEPQPEKQPQDGEWK